MNHNLRSCAWFRLAAAWMHNAGVPVMLVALTLRIKGFQAAEPLIGVASIVVGCSVLPFAWLVFARIGAQAKSVRSATRELRAS